MILFDLLTYFIFNLQGNANCGIEELRQTLLKIQKRRGGKLPPVLYLQADNCPKDNKNKYMLAFLTHLIQKRVFLKIRYSFLMVGHTWTDIDEGFGWIHGKLINATTGAPTLARYRELVHEAFARSKVHLLYICFI